MDRDEWRRSNAARVGHAAYKLLDVLSGILAWPDGWRCWPFSDMDLTGRMIPECLRAGSTHVG